MADKKELFNYYNKSDAYIDEMQTHDDLYFQSYINFLEKYVTRSGKLLDIGCGSGQSTLTMAEKFPNLHCTGMDISVRAIERAKQKFKRENLDFFSGDLHEMKNEEAVYDYVVSYDCFEHIPDIEQAFLHVMKMIRPGGLFLLKGPNHMSPLYTLIDLLTLKHKYPFTTSWLDNFKRLSFELGHYFSALGGKVNFVTREPDLTDNQQVGDDADAVNDMSNITVANFFRKQGWKIRNIAWPRSDTRGGNLIVKVLPHWASMGIVAEKP